jgi:uncharacterized tellurite resistance protein B-like protein
MNEELAAFAEEVRRACIDIAGAAGAMRLDLVNERTLALCTRAAIVKQGEEMKRELAAEDRFSLAGLSVNLADQRREGNREE